MPYYVDCFFSEVKRPQSINRISNMSAHIELVVESDKMRGLVSIVSLFATSSIKLKTYNTCPI